MKFSSCFLKICIGLLMLCSLLNAQQPTASVAPAVVPRLVNFSGKVVNAEGKTISGIAGVTFAIYQEQSGGSPLWIETQNVQADSKGSYTAQLGATKPEGLPLDLFTSGAARWLGVSVNGGEEQPRVLLLSVPYALKAADAETVGGLPASAFLLAAPAAAGGASTSVTTSGAAVPAAVSGTGTTDFLPLWTNSTGALGNSILFQSGAGATAKVGINTSIPAVTLDVNGSENVHGTLSLLASGAATATAGKNSQPQDFITSVFNSSTATAIPQKFQWQAEPVGNNTASPAGALSLLYASGSAAPAETGLKISNKGVIGFAAGQTFPIANASITDSMLAHPSVTINSGVGLAGGQTVPLGGSMTLNLNTSEVPLLATANLFTNSQGVNGAPNTWSFTVANPNYQTILTQGPVSEIGTALEMQTTGTGGMSWQILNTGAQSSQGTNKLNFRNDSAGVDVMTMTASGEVGIGTNSPTATLDVQGNATQTRTAGGFVKAMALVDQTGIRQCYNSTLSGAAATTSPCNFFFHEWGKGDYTIDFQFIVHDRFISVTPGGTNGAPATGMAVTACVLGLGAGGCNNTITSTQVEVTNFCALSGLECTGFYIDNQIYVIVY